MARNKSIGPAIVIALLIVAGLAEGVQIIRQGMELKQLHAYKQSEYRIISGNIEDTNLMIDSFAKSKDRTLLKDLYVRLWWLQNEAYRVHEVLVSDEPASASSPVPTTPSGLVDLIQRHNIDTDQALTYLQGVQAKLREYQQTTTAPQEVDQDFSQFRNVWGEISRLAIEKHAEWNLP